MTNISVGNSTEYHTRLRKKQKLLSNYEDDSSSKAEECKSITARKKTIRGKLGRLAGLLEFPLDILFEIFGHLNPYDLLRLARTTKGFRRLLMHRSSTSVWKSARKTVPGLPNCPTDMAEPEWANLVFSPHCHFCFASNIQNVVWILRIRICYKCSDRNMSDFKSVRFFALDQDFTASQNEHFESLEDALILTHRKWGHPCRFLIEDYKSIKRHYFSLQDQRSREAFISARVATFQSRRAHAKICETWISGQWKNRSQELQSLRNDRRDAIMAKLEELGWGEEIAHSSTYNALIYHKLVKQPQRLTERIWNKVKEPIQVYMQHLRDRRIAHEHAALVIRRKSIAANILRAYKNSHLPCVKLMPEGPDFCDFPAIKSILELPTEIEVNNSSFNAVLPLLPNLFKQWREERRTGLPCPGSRDSAHTTPINDITSSEKDGNDIPGWMKLASTVYGCADCSYTRFEDTDEEDDGENGTIYTRPLFYPQILGHSCLTREKRQSPTNLHNPDASKDLDSSNLRRCKWSRSKLFVSPDRSEVAKAVVEQAGLDPETTSSEDMDRLGKHFICLSCVSGTAAATVRRHGVVIDIHQILYPLRNWRETVKHACDEHQSNFRILPITLKGILPELDEKFIWAEDIQVRYYKPIWQCAHCRDSPAESQPTTLPLLQKHIAEIHDISEPVINKDYTKSPEALNIYPAFDKTRLNTFLTFERMDSIGFVLRTSVGRIPLHSLIHENSGSL